MQEIQTQSYRVIEVKIHIRESDPEGPAQFYPAIAMTCAAQDDVRAQLCVRQCRHQVPVELRHRLMGVEESCVQGLEP